MNKILIIEDDLEINALLADFLKEKGYAVHCQYDGLHVLDFLNKEKIDLIILDIMLPYRSGDIILSDVRKKFTIPVIIISAKETTQNKIDLLRLGADDYICKPFGVMELRARIAAHLRREHREHSIRMVLGPVCFNLSLKQMMLNNQEIMLTKVEYEICEFLAKNRGQVFSKEQILERVLGFDSASNDSTITTHIKNIRTKFLSYDYMPIKTVWGIGYKWEE